MQATPELQRMHSGVTFNLQVMPTHEPKGFSYDVIMPNQAVLQSSPLKNVEISNEVSSDTEKDHDSTNYSSGHSQEHNEKEAFTVNGIVVDNFLASDDLNECVDALLRKNKVSTLNIKQVIRHNNSSKHKDKKRRLRKNREQHLLLLNMYKNDPNWDKNMIQKLSDELGLKESQIYKWNWDQRKKDNMFWISAPLVVTLWILKRWFVIFIKYIVEDE